MATSSVTKAAMAAAILEGLTEAAIAEQQRKVWDNLDVQIEHQGRTIKLPSDPSDMPLEKAVEALERRIDDENQMFRVFEVIDAYPHDAAVAFVKAMNKLYGFASPQTRMTMFGPQPPQMLSIKVGPGLKDVVQCPLGKFKLPGVDEGVTTAFSTDDKQRPIFVVLAEVPKKKRHLLIELAEETRRIVKAESIYLGKAIRLGVNDDGDLNLNDPPDFLDVSDTTEADLLFDNNIWEQIHTNILVPMKDTERCQKMKIPLKRSALLEGPFGTGKSLVSRMTANVATRHGWTFILLDKVQGLRVALEFANRYAPAVVFAEDIDRIASVRDDGMNDLINIMDGVVSKRAQVMTVLTTNFVHKLDPVILRPGRLDAVISLRAPGPETVQKLVRHYGGDLLIEDVDLSEVGEELKGQIPASIRECVERAKLGMIGRGDNNLIAVDLVTAAQTMKNHLALLNKEDKTETDAEKLASSLKAIIGNGHANNTNIDLSNTADTVGANYSVTQRVEKRVMAVQKLMDDGNITKALLAINDQLAYLKTGQGAIAKEVEKIKKATV